MYLDMLETSTYILKTVPILITIIDIEQTGYLNDIRSVDIYRYPGYFREYCQRLYYIQPPDRKISSITIGVESFKRFTKRLLVARQSL